MSQKPRITFGYYCGMGPCFVCKGWMDDITLLQSPGRSPEEAYRLWRTVRDIFMEEPALDALAQQPAAVDGAARLTERQAVIVTGYTGVLCCKFDAFHADLERRAGRRVWTHEMGNHEWIKPMYRDDFLALAAQHQEPKSCQPAAVDGGVKTCYCYQCDRPVTWLAPDSRCGDCTRLTPEEL